MRFILAPDSFKESMTAREAALAMSLGVRDALPDAECVLVPMSDGGEGFVDAIASALDAKRVRAASVDALGRPIEAEYALVGSRAILDVASCAGLELLAPAERDAAASSTEGLGLLIRDALSRGADSLLIGIGGSATNDAGAGMLVALGARLIDEAGAEVRPLPAELGRAARIDLSGLDERLAGVRVDVASDVTNPLCGPNGATAVFGPQKGVPASRVAEFDAALAGFARASGSPALADLPGSGAAGGLGFALRAFLGASLAPGVDLVADAVGLDEAIAGASLVLTGEGSVDAQTLHGKAPAGVLARARAAGIPVLVFAGRAGEGAEVLLGNGVERIVVISDPAAPLTASLRNGPANLRRAVAEALR